MPIREGNAVATREDIAAVQAVAQSKLRQLEAQQGEQLQQHRWADARALTASIVEQRSWLSDLTRYAASLNEAPARTLTSSGEWIALLDLLAAEYDVALAAAIERPSADALHRAETAWRTLSTFRNDALEATGDRQRFDPRGTPPMPAQHPRARTAGVDLQKLSIRRNPTEARPPIDRTRWQHLLPA